MRLAISDALVVECPELCREIAAIARLRGFDVICTTQHGQGVAQAVLGSRARYEPLGTHAEVVLWRQVGANG